MKQNRPAIGTKMYAVHEHNYYIPGHAAPLMEYCVCEAEVRGFLTGSYTEVKLVGPSPDGYNTPYYYKLSNIDKCVFYTPTKAALLAKEMTERYEHTWGWLGTPNIPMRRTWMKYLTYIGVERENLPGSILGQMHIEEFIKS